ncbi:hypothetical protein AWU65_15280 [Paenibacillus glucanolyticus]|uniref:DUF308 domain-containing protein n=1 Tax=Paenibacillus glucanolyticus TaxID=59843 RepID=A0A162EL20_9BACL|nr:hypothetical protein [Paenibacillus glucanolyticus]KZS47191.1 hypothetical protein AWU65_15280 [Paenibacillus glucanolyticus]
MHNGGEYTDLGLSASDRILIWTAPPILGAVVGWFLPAIADWATGLAWVPFQGPLELIASIQGPWVVILTANLGLIAGMLLSRIAVKESLALQLSDQEITFSLHEAKQTFAREEVSAVFLDGKQLVLLGAEGQELYRAKPEAKRAAVAEAFRSHGYSWRDSDPFADHYVRWVVDSPGLTPSMNALFLAREKALEMEEKEDAADLRRELSKLGITVRDEDSRQYWRPHGQRP